MSTIFDIFTSDDASERYKPDVIIDFIFEKGLFFISIQNIGLCSAYDISVEFNKKLTGPTGINKKIVSDLSLFKDISFMPPNKEIRTFLDTSASYFDRNEPTRITTCITFKNDKGDSFINKIRHNLEIYRNIGYISHE